ncbi:hypothetical protein RN001_006017 [Aquatica leii]|uniref:Uncharacterized protein n=1 Tax=Aquatica leii TaxID=1421715 RepID=A0AAN7PDH6_9COLE|nr:hypothetical protein RN001_006017 [Aquatica leii]
MKIHQYEKLTPFQLILRFTKAYLQIANAEKAVNGFKSAGIWPFDPYVLNQLIQEGDPAPPENVPAEEAILESENVDNTSNDPINENADRKPSLEPALQFSPLPSGLNLPKCNKENVERVKKMICTSPVRSSGSSSAVPFSLISPKPENNKDDGTRKNKDSEKGKRKCKSNKQHSTIATATPINILFEQLDFFLQKFITSSFGNGFVSLHSSSLLNRPVFLILTTYIISSFIYKKNEEAKYFDIYKTIMIILHYLQKQKKSNTIYIFHKKIFIICRPAVNAIKLEQFKNRQNSNLC